jgi:hypothetical protein
MLLVIVSYRDCRSSSQNMFTVVSQARASDVKKMLAMTDNGHEKHKVRFCTYLVAAYTVHQT